MKTYRQKTRAGASSSNGSSTPHQGPDEDKIKAILDRTGYSLDVTTGQRKYGGPPPGWDGPSPGNGCEVFKFFSIFSTSSVVCVVKVVSKSQVFIFIEPNDMTIGNDSDQTIDCKCYKMKYWSIWSELPFLQVFCGKIPKDIYEDELIPHFEKCGKIWDLRLMMDPMTGLNRLEKCIPEIFIRFENQLICLFLQRLCVYHLHQSRRGFRSCKTGSY